MKMFRSKKGKEYALAMLAVVAVVAVAGLIMMFSGNRGVTGAVPTQVYEVSQGNAVGLVDVAAGKCKYNNAGNLLCPGTPNANTQFCLETMSEAGLTGDDLLLTVQECVSMFGRVNVATQSGLAADGSCPVADAWTARNQKIVENCQHSLTTVDGKLRCTLSMPLGRLTWVEGGSFGISFDNQNIDNNLQMFNGVLDYTMWNQGVQITRNLCQ